MRVTMVNRRTGEHRIVKRGFSWTTLLFSFLVPLVRADWKWFWIMSLSTLFIGVPTAGFGLILIWPVFAANYNSRHIEELRQRGFEDFNPVDSVAGSVVVETSELS